MPPKMHLPSALSDVNPLPVKSPSPWTLPRYPSPGFLVYFLSLYICCVTFMQAPWAGALPALSDSPPGSLVQASLDVPQHHNVLSCFQLQRVSFLCSWDQGPWEVCLVPLLCPLMSVWEALTLRDPTKSNPPLVQPHL